LVVSGILLPNFKQETERRASRDAYLCFQFECLRDALLDKQLALVSALLGWLPGSFAGREEIRSPSSLRWLGTWMKTENHAALAARSLVATSLTKTDGRI
jgi:hypothetical protein